VSEVHAAADGRAADWVLEGVRNFDYTVGSLVPAAFERYARVFHPAARRDAPDVRWQEVASANGRTMHPAAEWGSLTGSWRIDGQPDLWDEPPKTGQLPQRLAVRLASALAPYAEDAEHCHFGVWEGWGVPGLMLLVANGTPEGELRRARDAADAEVAAWQGLLDRSPKFVLPGRPMHLLEGPLDALPSFYARYRDIPSLWWPEDRAWCVATDIDLMSTYVGGSSAALDALLGDEQIEALAVPVDQSVTWEADTLNPLPKRPS
jgi:hypothetical protein